MTLAVDGNPQQYTGTGADTALDTVFKFFADTDIVVTQRITATGVSAVLVKDTHYTVAGGSTAGAVGTVTPIDGATDFTTAMTWTVQRDLPETQATDYVANDAFPAASHEADIDKTAMHLQDIRARSERSLRFPVDDTTSLTSEITDSVARASKYLAFDASGNVTVTTTAPAAVGSGKILLASDTVAAAATASVSITDWPATYDRVELEMIGVFGGGIDKLVIEPIDSGTAVSANLESNSQTIRAGTGVDDESTSTWETRDNASYHMGTAIAASLNGAAVFTSVGDYIYGVGHYTWYNGGLISTRDAYVSTATGTRWDGFEVSVSGTTITGTFRLWGIPKA